jgi:hypothetical protein
MAIQEFKQAMQHLVRTPVLWVPGIISGVLGAVLWISFNLAGTFFTTRLLVISGLVLIFFITGLIAMLKSDAGDIRTMIHGGSVYYFRVLLPQLVILFGILLVCALLMVTLTFAGISEAADLSMTALLTIVIMIPILIFTFFFDMAAVFEDRHVFDSLKRSIMLVSLHLREVIVFLLVNVIVIIGIVFALMIVWEAFLYNQLEPITHYTETQLQSFTPDQLIALIGPGGMWVTAGIIFAGIALLFTILYTYKAWFFRKMASAPLEIQQPLTGEYDSKGRYYKY